MKEVSFSKTALAEAEEIIQRYPQKQAAMLPILYLAEREFGYISSEVEHYVGDLLDVPAVKVHEVMTFYTLIAGKPLGKHHFQVCRGLSCDLRGCSKIIETLEQTLQIKTGETRSDKRFTLSAVECLGACETAPMMQLDEDYLGELSVNKLRDIVNSLR